MRLRSLLVVLMLAPTAAFVVGGGGVFIIGSLLWGVAFDGFRSRSAVR